MDLSLGGRSNWSGLVMVFLPQLTVKEVAALGINGSTVLNTKLQDVD